MFDFLRSSQDISWRCFRPIGVEREAQVQKLPMVSGEYLPRESNAFGILFLGRGEFVNLFSRFNVLTFAFSMADPKCRI